MIPVSYIEKIITILEKYQEDGLPSEDVMPQIRCLKSLIREWELDCENYKEN